MYIRIEDLEKKLSDKVWRYYTDHIGKNIFQLIDELEKIPEKKTIKKKGEK